MGQQLGLTCRPPGHELQCPVPATLRHTNPTVTAELAPSPGFQPGQVSSPLHIVVEVVRLGAGSTGTHLQRQAALPTFPQ
mmetsp:Transcript_82492/g.163813  ORF Transcript_82492/g.163813 Transcript_82492/m.163813 type:complete len:80 (+) Transcript_82492:2976-3215(+)